MRLKSIFKILLLMIIGGLVYITIELTWRGRSHWTMFILGGMCFTSIGAINELFSWRMKLWVQGIIGAYIVTILEFITGLIVNMWLGWNVWDYSDTPLNIMGQICVPYTLIWFGISILAIFLDDFLRWKLLGEEKPRYDFF